MKFEVVQIYFLYDILVCCHPKFLLPWQCDVTTSPLYVCSIQMVQILTVQKTYNKTFVYSYSGIQSIKCTLKLIPKKT